MQSVSENTRPGLNTEEASFLGTAAVKIKCHRNVCSGNTGRDELGHNLTGHRIWCNTGVTKCQDEELEKTFKDNYKTRITKDPDRRG